VGIVSASETKSEHKPVWRRVAEALGLIAGLIGSLTAIISAYNEVSVFVFAEIDRLRGTAPSDLVVSVAPDHASAQIYGRIFAEAGLHAKSLTADQIESLSAEPAGVVIIDGRINTLPANFSAGFRKRPLERARLIAMGRRGSTVIGAVEPGTVLQDIEFERNDPVILGALNLPAGLTTGLPADQPFRLYTGQPQNELTNSAVYDQHSLLAIGALGVVRRAEEVRRFQCAGDYWPVVQQGRAIFWGYEDDPQNLTEEGKRLLVNLVKYLLADQANEASAAPAASSQNPPLQYSDKLDCTGTAPVDEQIYAFAVDQPGMIRIKVDSQQSLSLILNGPGRINAYARKDGVAPEIAYAVTVADIVGGTRWRVSVKDFSLKQGDKVAYAIRIDFPPPRISHLVLWMFIGVVGLALFLLIAVVGVKRLNALIARTLSRGRIV